MRFLRGFSLLELVVVLIIMALLAAIAVPRYGHAIARQRVDAVARRIIVDLSLARRQARMAGSSQEVRFDVAQNRYTLTGLPHLNRSSNEYAVSLSSEPYLATLLSADFDSSDTVTFDGYGVPDSGGQIVVRVGDYQKTISLDVETGEANIQ